MALLMSCATVSHHSVEPEFQLRLAPVALGVELQLSQRLTVIRGDEHRSFEAQFEVDADSLRIAAVALGQTLASISWDGTHLEEHVSTLIPSFISASRILTDVQLAFWPSAAIRSSLPLEYTLEEGILNRRLLHHGEIVAFITYEGTSPAWRRVRLEQRHFGYTLEIESVEVSQ